MHSQSLKVISAVTLLMLFGIAGYTGIEGWSVFDAIYMTIIISCQCVEAEISGNAA